MAEWEPMAGTFSRERTGLRIEGVASGECLRPPHFPLHALERARLQFAVQHPRRIDRPRQDDPPGGRRRESHPAVIRLVADQEDQPGAAGARGFERARDERLADAPAAKHRLDDQRAEQEGWRLPDPDRRHRVRADEQGADPGDETQRQIGGRRLAQAVSGARETARPEYALVEPKNGFGVVRRLRFENQRQIGHGGSGVLATGASNTEPRATESLAKSAPSPKRRDGPLFEDLAEAGARRWRRILRQSVVSEEPGLQYFAIGRPLAGDAKAPDDIDRDMIASRIIRVEEQSVEDRRRAGARSRNTGGPVLRSR